MLTFLLWYVLLSVLGWLAFPLAYRLLSALPERGYAFSRTLGVLLWGYAFWLLTSLGVLQNTPGSLWILLLAFAALAVWLARREPPGALRMWLREHRATVLTTEILFFAAFAFMAWVRAANPDIVGTEKPMELAFINAILRSPTFPPHDPWLSGYAISYYYFGYVLVAMFAKLTGTLGSVAFNLGLALTFSLSALGAYGVVYNLLAVLRPARPPVLRALFAPLMLLLVGNLAGLLEVLHRFGLFWRADGTSGFWGWLNLQDLNRPPTPPLNGLPDRFWWWWRASRVLQDFKMNGDSLEIIDEFPAFSYVLGDLHPHVLAMPFALLAIGLALNLFLGGAQGKLRLPRFALSLSPTAFASAALVLGGLAFLNTWDFPMYVAVFSGAYALRLWRTEPNANWLVLIQHFIGLGVLLGVAGGVLYLPFYFGFASQAGGIVPNVIFVTRGVQFWVMFGTLLIPLGLLLYAALRGSSPNVALALKWVGGLFAMLWGAALLLAFVAVLQPQIGAYYLDLVGLVDGTSLFAASVQRILAAPGAWLTLFALLAAVLAFLLRSADQPEGELTAREIRSLDFALLLTLLGGLLALAPEFFYLRDQFGWRMNTIFKFYYQTWLLWSLAGAFGLGFLLGNRRTSPAPALVALGSSITLLAGIVYTALAFPAVTQNFQPVNGYTLDGAAYLRRYKPADMQAIEWLRRAPDGVVAEAVGGSYSEFARVATNSGLPSVLGWPGHESQWRGGAREMGSRADDLKRLYESSRWEDAAAVLAQYHIRYVFVGSLEYTAYRVNLNKFDRNLRLVYDVDGVRIYEAPQE
ncbi:MAG: DUF2298 domain-containing protein [Anaerolineales bacterium]